MNQSSSDSTLLVEAPCEYLAKIPEHLEANSRITIRIYSTHEGNKLMSLPTETDTICSSMFAWVRRRCPFLSNCSVSRLQLVLGKCLMMMMKPD